MDCRPVVWIASRSFIVVTHENGVCVSDTVVVLRAERGDCEFEMQSRKWCGSLPLRIC